MAKIFGTQFSAADAAQLAQGEKHDAALRVFSNDVNLATEGGGTSDTLIAGRVPKGCCIKRIEISCSTDASGRTFGIGIAGATTKYGATVTGPAAGATVSVTIPPAMRAAITANMEEIILTPSGNLPATGILEATIYASKR